MSEAILEPAARAFAEATANPPYLSARVGRGTGGPAPGTGDHGRAAQDAIEQAIAFLSTKE
ncbi:hypothetical protein [Sphaerisporangium perillae]|uniref:hypothetical protein n=1 Tax=Sphaerisporangium perillae TaxID=2935860 RepID=UPI00200DAB6C|nr:hypothetical protein [Sphaerisporangium perillae]